MPPFHVPSTSRALYRVFIVPTLTASFRPLPSTLRRTNALPKLIARGRSYKAAPVRRDLRDDFIFDNAIEAPRINFVDEQGEFHGDVLLSKVSYNRVTHHLLQVTPGIVDEYGRPSTNPKDMPTCKIISKIDLRAQHQKKLDLEKRKTQGQGTGPGGKNLELNWAIAGGDLKHRLGKIKEFLKEGRRVEILFGAKRRGKVATKEECKELMDKVRNAVGECEGSVQVKEPDGEIGGVMTMFFQGKKMEGVGDPVKKEEARKGRRVIEREKEINNIEE